MAKKSSKDYFGLGYLISVILAIIPVTAWILGILTRLSEGKIVAGILRIFFAAMGPSPPDPRTAD